MRQGSTIFLVSPSQTPCGVETFARHLARTWGECGYDARQIAISGRLQDFWQVWRALQNAETLVINGPVVAWKRVILLPLLLLLLARLRGSKVVQILHEWADLDPRRRLVLFVYLLSATHVLYSSPTVREQHRRNRFTRLLPVEIGLVPIPPNIAPAEAGETATGEAARKIAAARRPGRIILGHFGSIYPRKRSDRILEIAAELKRRGHDVLLAYVGDFVRGTEDIEDVFDRRIAGLGLKQDVLITGYIASHAEVYAALREVDVLVYSFADGLSSRRGSVLAALLSGRPVVVNAPQNDGEFDHHPAFRRALGTGALRLVGSGDDIEAYADAIERARGGAQSAPFDFDRCWRDAAAAFAAGLCKDRLARPAHAAIPAE